MEIEYTDCIGVKLDGSEIKFKTPSVHVPKLKMKDFIRDCYGNDFDDEDSIENTMLFAMENFLKWYQEQSKLVKEQDEY